MPELQFDGLVGNTHNYGGLSQGNVACTVHSGQTSSPRAAAREGLRKMLFVKQLGVKQAVLPPHDRPSLAALRGLGFRGSDEEMIAAAGKGDAFYLRLCSSASAMWTANAATVAPSRDTADGKVHLTPANLQAMFHRSIEPQTTTRILRAIFANRDRFTVHEPLPGGGQFADEGAANHTRLATSKGVVHLFAWGRAAWGSFAGPSHFPARQTREASQALARLHQLPASMCRFPQQHPDGIDGGAFHTDVLAVGNERVLLVHDFAFAQTAGLVAELSEALGDELIVIRASESALPVERAVASYPFNSQVLSLEDGTMAIIAPEDAREEPAARAFLERVVATQNVIRSVHYLDVRQSMHNGGGPACLRLRVLLEPSEISALSGNVLLTDELYSTLGNWVDKHYRETLGPGDLLDPALARESMTALDELTNILRIGPVYDFQRTGV